MRRKNKHYSIPDLLNVPIIILVIALLGVFLDEKTTEQDKLISILFVFIILLVVTILVLIISYNEIKQVYDNTNYFISVEEDEILIYDKEYKILYDKTINHFKPNSIESFIINLNNHKNIKVFKMGRNVKFVSEDFKVRIPDNIEEEKIPEYLLSIVNEANAHNNYIINEVSETSISFIDRLNPQNTITFTRC